MSGVVTLIIRTTIILTRKSCYPFLLYVQNTSIINLRSADSRAFLLELLCIQKVFLKL